MTQPTWGDDWAVDLRVWVERKGHAVLGKGRLELLEGIDRWHSIRAAAAQMGMSYRRAWLLVQSVNEAAGRPLIVAATGGSHGGGAQLTPLGRQALTVFRELQAELQRTAATLLPRLVRGPRAPTVHVAAAVSLDEVLGQLLADYALRQPGVAVRAIFGASDELAEQLLNGAPADLFLTADVGPLQRLEAAGLANQRERRVLVENTLAALAPAGSSLQLRKPKDLLRPTVQRLALAAPGVPLGAYSQAWLEAERLYELLKPKMVFLENSRAVLTAVRAGQADAGIVYGSDSVRAGECRVLFQAQQLPRPIRYLAARLAHGRHRAEAAAFLDFLGSPAALPRWRQCGFRALKHRS